MKKLSERALPLYARLLSYVLPFWPMLLMGIIANVFASAIDAGLTYLMRPLLDKSFIHPDISFIEKIPIWVLIGITSRGLINAFANYSMTWVARSVVQVLREKVFAHILKLPASYYDEATSGQFLSKIIYDVEQVAQVSSDALTDFVQNTCLVIGLLSVMFIINWQLASLFLLIVPFIAFLVNYTNKRIRRISHKVQKSMGEMTEIASEAIDGYAVVRIFGAEKITLERFKKAVIDAKKNDLKVAISKAINVAGVQSIIAVGITLIIVATIKLSTIITITAGSILAILAAMFQLIKPMKTLTNLNATIQKGLAGAESVFRLLDEPIENFAGKHFANKIKGSLRFEKVFFAYKNKKAVLKDISFHVEPGKSIALVGHSGSGKTTIANLIPRFYELTQGKIFIDDISIEAISLKDLRSKIALVSQKEILFNDTIEANIIYGQQNISKERILEASKQAYAHEFIEKLPQGYHTKIGENGVMLSGGQRQRLAIARAILKDAPILILDEATSALDSHSESYIQSALEDIMRTKTTIIIAHRLSTVKHVDEILVIDKGIIVERGNHNKLLSLNGYYAKLCKVQNTNEH